MHKTMLVSRRGFLGSGVAFGGGLLVTASLPGFALAETVIGGADAGADPAFKPSAYIAIGLDGQITFTIGKSEMGQGILTGMAQLIADELGCKWGDISVVQAKAAPEFGFPFNGLMVTGGSTSIRTEWVRMRSMGAAARMMLQQAAADRWQADVASLTVRHGVITDQSGNHARFADLAGDASKQSVPKETILNTAKERTVIGKSVKRLDTVQKITGRAQFGMDVQLPDMVTAIVVAPPQLMAPVKSFNPEPALARPGVFAVVQISSGIAIIGEHYWTVHSARDAVEIEWGNSPFAGVGTDEIRSGYRAALETPGKIAHSHGDIHFASKGRTITRDFEQPYLAHACMEPMNMTIRIKDGRADVWAPTQAQRWVQETVGKVSGIDPNSVAVHTTFLGGGFGRRSAQDFVQAAAEVAMNVDKPVKLVYSREDDMRAVRYRPFNMTRATATLDEAGNLAALDVRIATPSVSKWSGAAFLIGKDGVDKHAVAGLADLPYDIPSVRVQWIDHDPKIPIHFWRAVGGSHNPYVLECLLDDIAKTAGSDPLAIRRQLLQSKPRHLAVLEQLADDADWATAAPAGVGRGLALAESFGSIVAHVADMRIVDGLPRVDTVTSVIDCGVAINPGQIEAQVQSSVVFGIGAFLRGEITLDNGAVEQSNFHDYEPVRMPEMPKINVRIIEGSDKPGGVGEPGLPPILPAMSNALFALTGRHTLRLPYTSAA